MRASHKVLSSKTIFKGKLVTLKVDQVAEPGGVRAAREVVCHPGSVVVLPTLPDGRVVLVRQFRYAAGQSLWELVAGGIEPGETPRQAARREMIEETGYRCAQLTPLLEFFPSPGILTEKMHLVRATGLTAAEAHPEADERIRVDQFTLRQVGEMLRSGKIRDGKTLVGLYWLLYQAQLP